MTHNRRAGGVLVFAALVLASAAACSGTDKKTGDPTPFTENPTAISGLTPVASFPVDIPRSDGKTLTITAPPVRIVSLSPGATESIYALGAEALLVAVDNAADFPAAAAAFTTRLDASAPNVDAIAALNPDLVIVSADNGGVVAKLDQLSIPVFYQDTDKDVTTIDAVFAQITLLGKVTGKPDAAAMVVNDLGSRVQKVKDAVQGVNSATSPKVYHEVNATFATISDGTFVGDIYRTLRARNIAGDGGGSPRPQLTQDAIIASGPDVIVLTDEAQGVTIDSVKARPGWNTIPAVTNDRIAGIDHAIVDRPGPRIVDALEQLGKIIYPTRFP